MVKMIHFSLFVNDISNNGYSTVTFDIVPVV